MDSEEQQANVPETRGILVSIDDGGRVKAQVLGRLNEAEFLGIGAYLQNTLLREGMYAVVEGQRSAVEVLREIARKIDGEAEKETGEEPCSKERCSECSPSSDSGLSSGSSQPGSEG